MIIRILAALVAIATAAVGFEAFRFVSSGPGAASDTLVFEVPPGTAFRTVAQGLEERGVVRSAFNLRVLARLTHQDHLKRGEYALNKGMTPREVLSMLATGRSIQYPITFPRAPTSTTWPRSSTPRAFTAATIF